jgi:hypothetical protein
MLRAYWKCARALMKFRGYRPQAVTRLTFMLWLRQFTSEDRKHLLTLLDRVIYLTEDETKRVLLNLNRSLLRRLNQAGIANNKIIYVQIDDAGSSSPVILNLLRDAANLERLGCQFIDSNNVRGLNDLTSKLEEGAIIYVDDFIGTGNQFSKVRKFVGEYIVGNFPEFLLAPAICEEGIFQLGKIGVEPVSGHVHSKTERPLHQSSSILPENARDRLRKLCLQIHPQFGLGYKELATMVILYRNAPNTVPLILRGALNQHPQRGIFPRHSDLPMR